MFAVAAINSPALTEKLPSTTPDWVVELSNPASSFTVRKWWGTAELKRCVPWWPFGRPQYQLCATRCT